MAYTTSTLVDTYMGQYRHKVIRATADAATQNIDTGLGNIAWAGAVTVSNAADNWICYYNSLAAGTAAAGYIGVSGATSGDIMDIIIYGYDDVS